MAPSAAMSQLYQDVRSKSLREANCEDEKRMRFLALLCGSNSFRSGSNHASGQQISRDRSESISKGRSTSLGGKDDYRHHNMDANAMGTSATSSAIPTSTSTANYTPTTPQNLSRRILHTQGCGYYDDAVSLLLSAASDRFLSSVLTQAKACRDRRLEGQKATLVECRRRKRHRRRVCKERLEREKRFKEEVDRKRSSVEEVSGDAEKQKTNLKQSDIEKLQDFRKENEDMDKEEDYYHSYCEDGKMENGEDEDLLLSEEDDSDDDDDEVIEDKQYDLLLRDIVRPLGAWGFDVSSKIGFDSSNDGGMDEEHEYVDNDQEDDDHNEEEDEDEGRGDETDNDDNISPKKKPPPAKKKAGIQKTKKRKIDETSSGSNAAPSAKKPAVDKSTADENKSAKGPPTTAAPQPPSTTDKPSNETK